MKIGFVLGTRPEIIKCSPLIRLCKEKNLDFFIVHSNQHYSSNMDHVFFEELELPVPSYNLNINQCSHAQMTGRMMQSLESVFLDEKPDVIFVQGDTNTVLSAALTASKLNVRIGHIEAGLRSYDRSMPEEINRILTDPISDWLFCPTALQQEILLNEQIAPEKIFVVGNVIVDAVFQNLKLAHKKHFLLEENPFMLLTLHRPANVDNPETLSRIFDGLDRLSMKMNMKILFSIHPRTKSNLLKFGLKVSDRIKFMEPVGYLKFLLYMEKAHLILTDSGGIQEEACILRRPCVTLRENTERPETLQVGANLLAGSDPDKILECADRMLMLDPSWDNPFGDGSTSSEILDIVSNYLKG